MHIKIRLRAGEIDKEEQSALQTILVDASFHPDDVKRAIKEMDHDG
jgi:hypothetical protein